MKKLFLSIALIAFISSTSISVYANSNNFSSLECEKCEKGKEHKCNEKCEKDCKKSKSHCDKKKRKKCNTTTSCAEKGKEDGTKKCNTAKPHCSHSSKDSIPAN